MGAKPARWDYIDLFHRRPPELQLLIPQTSSACRERETPEHGTAHRSIHPSIQPRHVPPVGADRRSQQGRTGPAAPPAGCWPHQRHSLPCGPLGLRSGPSEPGCRGRHSSRWAGTADSWMGKLPQQSGGPRSPCPVKALAREHGPAHFGKFRTLAPGSGAHVAQERVRNLPSSVLTPTRISLCSGGLA